MSWNNLYNSRNYRCNKNGKMHNCKFSSSSNRRYKSILMSNIGSNWPLRLSNFYRTTLLKLPVRIVVVVCPQTLEYKIRI